eukprot:1142766-Pelagomonas_calceolata.AAC.3
MSVCRQCDYKCSNDGKCNLQTAATTAGAWHNLPYVLHDPSLQLPPVLLGLQGLGKGREGLQSCTYRVYRVKAISQTHDCQAVAEGRNRSALLIMSCTENMHTKLV